MEIVHLKPSGIFKTLLPTYFICFSFGYCHFIGFNLFIIIWRIAYYILRHCKDISFRIPLSVQVSSIIKFLLWLAGKSMQLKNN